MEKLIEDKQKKLMISQSFISPPNAVFSLVLSWSFGDLLIVLLIFLKKSWTWHWHLSQVVSFDVILFGQNGACVLSLFSRP